MNKQIITGSRVGGVGPGQKGGHVLDLLAARQRGNVTYTLAEVRQGTGWPRGTRFQVVAQRAR